MTCNFERNGAHKQLLRRRPGTDSVDAMVVFVNCESGIQRAGPFMRWEYLMRLLHPSACVLVHVRVCVRVYVRYGTRYVRTSYCVAEVNATSLVSYLYARVGATGLLKFGLSSSSAFQRQPHKYGIGPGCEYTSCA